MARKLINTSRKRHNSIAFTVIVHLRCLCDFSLLRYEEDDPSAACSFRQYAVILLIGSPSVLCSIYLF